MKTNASENGSTSETEEGITWREGLRAVWWVIALVLCIILIASRFDVISSSTPSTFDTGLLAIVAILTLLPFMSEISAFGFTVKKQIEEVRKEIKQDVKEAATEIRQDVKEDIRVVQNELLALNLRNTLTSNVTFQTGIPNPPPDDALEEIRDKITKVLSLYQEDRDHLVTQPYDAQVAQDTIFAFTQRYLLEQQVRRIWMDRVADSPFFRYLPFSRMIDDLLKYQLINQDLTKSLKEVYSVASAIVHGDEPSQEKIHFLHDTAPEMIGVLGTIK